MTADEMKEIKDTNDENYIKEKIHYQNSFKECLLRIQTKIDNYQGQMRARHQIVKILDPDYSKQSMGMENLIRAYMEITF